MLSSCRNKITIVSVAKDIGSLCTARGDSGRRWRGGRGPQGERSVALINLTRFSFTDNLCIFWATTTTWVYLRVWNDLELSCTNGRQRGVCCFTVQFFDFFCSAKKASQVLFAVFGNVLRRMVISQRGRYPILCGLHGRFLVLEIPIIARLYKIWWWANPLPNLSTILGAARGK